MITKEKTPAELRQETRFINKSTRTAAKYLRRIEELRGMPKGIKPFLDTIKSVYVDLEPIKHEENQKLIGTYCVMVPQELIYAAGAVPVRLCSGSYAAFSIGDGITPRDSCPLVKATVGFVDMGTMPIYNDCDLMVVPVTCDCKKKMMGVMKNYTNATSLHVPSSKLKDMEKERYVDELYDLAAKLEDITGNRLSYKNLKKAANDLAQGQYEMTKFSEFKKLDPSVIKGTHAMVMMNAISYLPLNIWKPMLHELNNELLSRTQNKEYVSSSKEPRIMITGSPVVFPNLKLPLLIEEMGGILVGDETCMGERALYDPLVFVDNSFDGIMRSLANRYILPCTCPTFVDNKQRVFRIKQMIQDNKVEGIIYHVLRGCLVYDYEYSMLEEALSDMGIPLIRIESDYNEEDIEQIRVRMEAFIELIKLNPNRRK